MPHTYCSSVNLHMQAPVSTPARTFAWLEALTGQFYLAVLVAGLVGALLSKKSETGDTE